MNKGFTLIELLVVVLIIGILSSIALPQYTKAVEKSRAAEAQAYLADWITGQTIYHMSNGVYAAQADKDNMDVALPATLKNFTVGQINKGGSGNTTVGIGLRRTNSSMEYVLQAALSHSNDTGLDTPTLTCCGPAQICQAIRNGNSAWVVGVTTATSCSEWKAPSA
jgi:prepilin-type N-terminal cleavage/methylation domain-containing protein